MLIIPTHAFKNYPFIPLWKSYSELIIKGAMFTIVPEGANLYIGLLPYTIT